MFDYDGVYDEMKEKASRPKQQEKEQKKVFFSCVWKVLKSSYYSNVIVVGVLTLINFELVMIIELISKKYFIYFK